MLQPTADHFDAEYESLPAAIKAKYSKSDYGWMGEQRRAGLIEEETLPEVAED